MFFWGGGCVVLVVKIMIGFGVFGKNRVGRGERSRGGVLEGRGERSRLVRNNPIISRTRKKKKKNQKTVHILLLFGCLLWSRFACLATRRVKKKGKWKTHTNVQGRGAPKPNTTQFTTTKTTTTTTCSKNQQ